MRDLDLNLLVTFQALVQEASVTQAARKLGVSQPAISYALAQSLARAARLQIHPLPYASSRFVVKEYWHKRYHHEPANEWIRGEIRRLLQRPSPGAELFSGSRLPGTAASARR